MTAFLGARLGQYVVQNEIGRGGMAVVYRAHQPSLDRTVALKVLEPHATSRDALAAQFRHEATLVGRLQHPNILPIYELGEDCGRLYIAMAYAGGGTLKDRVGSWHDVSAIVNAVAQIAGALEHAHRNGVLHLDVKSSNIVLGDGGWPMLGDFGIAQLVGRFGQGPLMGTRAYMSPERLHGQAPDARADVYGLGVVLYELVVGALPGDPGTPGSVALALKAPALAAWPGLRAVIAQALAPRPEARFASAGALRAALESVADSLLSSPGSFQESAGADSPRRAPSPTYPPVPTFRDDPSGRRPESDTRRASEMDGSGTHGDHLLTVEPPMFERGPRTPARMPRGEIEIPAPQPAPTEPTFSRISVILPVVFAVVGMIGMLAATLLQDHQGGTGAWIMAAVGALSFGMMGVMSLTGWLMYRGQKATYKTESAGRIARYQAVLDQTRRELMMARDQQRFAMLETHPDLQQCLTRVERRDRRLWERSPRDGDFLATRVGLGSARLSVTIKPPRREPALPPEPLIDAAHALVGELGVVADVPVVVPLGQAGVVGLAGPRTMTAAMARAMVTQLATHHAPSEVKIAAVFPRTEADEWECLRWLPHTWSEDGQLRYLASDPGTAQEVLADLTDVLTRRRMNSIGGGMATGLGPPMPLPVFVVILADPSLYEGKPILPLLLSHDPSLGVVAIFLAPEARLLPQHCQAYVDALPAGACCVSRLGDGATVSIRPDQQPQVTCDRLTRALAPLHVRQLAAGAEVPSRVSLLDLFDVGRVEDLDVLERWRRSDPVTSLAAPLGRQAGAELVTLDLHQLAEGPHGLVAGAPGSGKSELLQTAIVSMAVQFHPHELAFVLIDYKGGAMAQPLMELPHVVGTFTNLQGNLAQRALTAIRAELDRRMRIITVEARARDIYDYQRRYREGLVREPLPHLVFVADEFAELKQEQPELMAEFAGASRVGRALGVHLILATQQPAGTVDDRIWANSRFRLCLRVERTEDSRDVLKRDDAAYIPKQVPGRAYLQVGEGIAGDLAEIQIGYAGADYAPGVVSVSAVSGIREVLLNGQRRRLGDTLPTRQVQTDQKQLDVVVDQVRDEAARAGIRRLPGPWLDPLPTEISLDDPRLLGTLDPRVGWDRRGGPAGAEWLCPMIGLTDDVAHQRQAPLRVDLGRQGNLIVYGAPGSGLDDLLQTLVTSIALTHRPDEVNFYLIDFDGQALSTFERLPHVSGVVRDDRERLIRLLRFLRREIRRRQECFNEAHASSLLAYRERTGDPMPAMVVVLDDYAGFVQALPDDEDLYQIAADGASRGIHLVVSASSPGAVRRRLSDSLTLALTLQLTDRGDYSLVVGPTMGLLPMETPGRGLAPGMPPDPPIEFQTALPVGGSERQRAGNLRSLIERIDGAWTGARARPMPVLPSEVALADVVTPANRWPARPPESPAVPIGLDVDDLEPFTIDLRDGPHFLVMSRFQGGKTTLLRSWILALAERLPPERLALYLIDFNRQALWPLAGLPHRRGWAEDDEQFGELLGELERELEIREQARKAAAANDNENGWLAGLPALVVAIDNFDALRDAPLLAEKERLDRLVQRGQRLGLHVLLAIGVDELRTVPYTETYVKKIQALQTGFLLGASDHEATASGLTISLKAEDRVSLPAGQGFFTRRQRVRRVKVATADIGALIVRPWVERIVERAAVPSARRGTS